MYAIDPITLLPYYPIEREKLQVAGVFVESCLEREQRGETAGAHECTTARETSRRRNAAVDHQLHTACLVESVGLSRENDSPSVILSSRPVS